MEVLTFAIIVILALASIIHAYSMGWQAGHDVHHDDNEHGGGGRPEPPNQTPTSYV